MTGCWVRLVSFSFGTDALLSRWESSFRSLVNTRGAGNRSAVPDSCSRSSVPGASCSASAGGAQVTAATTVAAPMRPSRQSGPATPCEASHQRYVGTAQQAVRVLGTPLARHCPNRPFWSEWDTPLATREAIWPNQTSHVPTRNVPACGESVCEPGSWHDTMPVSCVVSEASLAALPPMLDDRTLQKLSRRLTGFAVSCGLSRHDAEDCAQETALILVEKYPDKEEADAVPLAFRIIRWKISECRRRLSNSIERNSVSIEAAHPETSLGGGGRI